MDEVRLGLRTLEPRRQLLVNGRREPIGKRALDILSVLAEAGGKIVTKDELLDAVWPGVTVEENALQVHIVALRRALGPEADRLKTIRGIGYQLDIDGEDEAPSPPATYAGDSTALPAGPTPPPHAASPRPVFNLPRVPKGRLGTITGALAFLVALAGIWWFAGESLGLRPQERIPVVVRTLTAGGVGDPTEVALANGITDELIDRLHGIPELRVATVATDTEVPEASFANAYIVDGSIRRSGDELRVMTRLSDANGEILWSETFDRRLVELLDMQQHIAASIADALSVSFDVGFNSTAYGGTDNPEAYAAFLEYQANVFNPDQTVPMRQIERALALDPDYIQALANQATSYSIQINSTQGLTREQTRALLAKANQASARAVAANPELWIGHAARGWYHMARKDFRAAVRSFQRVADLDHGNEPGPRSTVATHELTFGRSTKALAFYDSSALIDPAERHSNGRAQALMNLGRFQEAIDLSLEITAGDPVSQRNLGIPAFWSYLALGEEQEAIRHSEQYFPLAAEGLRALRAEKALSGMSPAEIRRWADRRYGAGGSVLLATFALYAGYDGHPELAVELMRLALERPGGGVIGFLWNPVMAEARKTDAFETLVTDFGLVKIWRESGDWGDYCRPVNATEITCS